MSARDYGPKRGEVALLVGPPGEHDVRPSARREQRVYPDPDEEEEPINLLDDLPGAMGALDVP
jgi:hypothetical protein